MKEDAFRDNSIFAGITQFFDARGNEYRYERGHFYKRKKGEDAFVHAGIFQVKYQRNCKDIYSKALTRKLI